MVVADPWQKQLLLLLSGMALISFHRDYLLNSLLKHVSHFWYLEGDLLPGRFLLPGQNEGNYESECHGLNGVCPPPPSPNP